MPVNKSMLIRIIAIDRCLRNTTRLYNISDLQEACNLALKEFNSESNGISRRTIYNDLDFLKSDEGFSAPIVTMSSGGKKVYYSYSDKNFSILGKFLPANLVEISKTMVEFLLNFDGLAPLEEIRSNMEDLKKFYHIHEREQFVEFEHNFDYLGNQWFAPIFYSISNRVPLEVVYESYSRKRTENLIFHPCYLKSYMQRWYAIGYNETEDKPYWILALERIKSLKEKPELNFIQRNIDIKEYFYDVIGVTKESGKRPVEIRFKVHPDFEKYITTRPFHPSQKNRGYDADGWREFSLNVIINEELLNHLMLYMHYIKIISPPELKEKLLNRIHQILENNKN
jgi:predicted DNA-binding transcriptional regulator YafY